MKLKCINCDEVIPTANINIEKTLALCPACGSVFDFSPLIPRQKTKQRKVKQPESVRVQESPDKLTLSIPVIHEKGPLRWLMVGSLVVPFLIFARAVLIGQLAANDGIISLVVTAIVSCFVYFGLAALLDRRRIILDAHTLKHGYRPLPLFDGKTINIEAAVEVGCRPSAIASLAVNARDWYDVFVRYEDDRTAVVLQNIPHERAAYIAQELNEFLQSRDAQSQSELDVSPYTSHIDDIYTGEKNLLSTDGEVDYPVEAARYSTQDKR